MATAVLVPSPSAFGHPSLGGGSQYSRTRYAGDDARFLDMLVAEATQRSLQAYQHQQHTSRALQPFFGAGGGGASLAGAPHTAHKLTPLTKHSQPVLATKQPKPPTARAPRHASSKTLYAGPSTVSPAPDKVPLPSPKLLRRA